MSEVKDVHVIQKSPLGKDLDAKECQALLEVMKVARLKDKDVLVREDETDEALHLLASGRLDVSKKGPGGKPVHLHTMPSGELAGALGFVDGHPRTTTLRAEGDVTVYSLGREAFETLVEQHPWMTYHIMRAVTRTAHEVMLNLNAQLEELTNYVYKVHGRY